MRNEDDRESVMTGCHVDDDLAQMAEGVAARVSGEAEASPQARRDAERFLRAPVGLEYCEPEERHGLTQQEIEWWLEHKTRND